MLTAAWNAVRHEWNPSSAQSTWSPLSSLIDAFP